MSDLGSALQPLLDLAVAEDFGQAGDITSDAIFTNQQSVAIIRNKAPVVVYGLWILPLVARRIDPGSNCQLLVNDGAVLDCPTTVARLRGPTASLLKAERIGLNFLGYLSGIASQTRRFVEAAQKYGPAVILDTRKTLPGYRHLAKAAVAAGGGRNHRLGLFDQILIKDNHIDAAGSLAAAVAAARARWHNKFRIEVECRDLAEVRLALELAVDIIMLDNMDPAACRAAVELRAAEFPDSSAAFEVSGDMNLERLADYAGLGVEYISVGALTHSVVNANFSMTIETIKPGA